MQIRQQPHRYRIVYIIFGLFSLFLIWYYLSDTIVHFTTPYQFPINSLKRFPLSLIIFPAEVFSFLFSLYFVYVLLMDPAEEKPRRKVQKGSDVAILLPVYNEPKSIVEHTVQRCKRLRWRDNVNIYLLDDSTDRSCKKDMDALRKKYGIHIIRRKGRKGYKAGNINNAVKQLKEPFFVIFDADQAPEPDFLERTMDHFSNPTVAYVQTPQHFVNDSTPLERANKIGAHIFFHSQCASKAADGALPFCGTNAVLRTAAFKKIDGFSYYTATEDIELGIRLNEAGYHGVYVPQVLVHGRAPSGFDAYVSQQYRWSNGNLAIFREGFLKILAGRFSLRYIIHTFFTLAWWFIGIVMLIYILVPILALLLGEGTHHLWLPTSLIIILYLNVFAGISLIYFALQRRTPEKIRLKDALLQYSLLTNSMFIYARAALSAIFGRYIGFIRTSKSESGSTLRMVTWNLILSGICLIFSIWALLNALRSSDPNGLRAYLPISVWLLFYAVILASSILFVKTAKEVRYGIRV